MKRLHYIKTIVPLLLLFAFFTSFAQQEVNFLLNLKEGACFKVQSTTYLSSTENVSSDKENKFEFTSTTQFQVTKKTPLLYDLSFIYTDYYSSMKMGVKEIIVDPKSADMLNILNPSTQIAMIMNKPFSAKISYKGEVIEVKENKNIEKEFKKKTKKLSPALREQVYLFINEFIKNESLPAAIENWTSCIPISTVKIGDKWTVNKDSTSTVHYTFVEETDSSYIIKGKGNTATITTNEIQEMHMTINREEEFTLTIEFDKQTFLPKIIIKESNTSTIVEIPDYPAFSQPPKHSQSTHTLKISSCQ